MKFGSNAEVAEVRADLDPGSAGLRRPVGAGAGGGQPARPTPGSTRDRTASRSRCGPAEGERVSITVSDNGLGIPRRSRRRSSRSSSVVRRRGERRGRGAASGWRMVQAVVRRITGGWKSVRSPIAVPDSASCCPAARRRHMNRRQSRRAGGGGGGRRRHRRGAGAQPESAGLSRRRRWATGRAASPAHQGASGPIWCCSTFHLPQTSGIWVLGAACGGRRGPGADHRTLRAPGRVRQGGGAPARGRRLRHQAVRAGRAVGPGGGGLAAGASEHRGAGAARDATGAGRPIRRRRGTSCGSGRSTVDSWRAHRDPRRAATCKLTHLEFELLSFFCSTSRPGAFARRAAAQVWGVRQAVRPVPSTTSWRSSARSWRRDPDRPRHLLTVRGSGYRFFAGEG